jgi:hypothetical protein
MIYRYVYHVHSNLHCSMWNGLLSLPWVRNLLITIIGFWCCLDQISNVNQFQWLFTSLMILPVQCHVQRENNIMNSQNLRYCSAWSIIQCFAIYYCPHICDSNRISMKLSLWWTKGTCDVSILRISGSFIMSIFMGWCTGSIVWGSMIT